MADGHNVIIESRVRQTHYANHRRHADDSFIIGDLVYVSTADLSLPKGRATKLLPKYVGPFKVLEAHTNTSSYKVELPSHLRARNLHDRFHQSKIRPYHANDDALFPHREALTYYDFGIPDDQEWLVDEILSHKWEQKSLSLQIQWNLGDTTWEPFESCKDLRALSDYLQLIGVDDPLLLPRRGTLLAS